MLRRAFDQRLARLLRAFPAVCILGPRQCGKTTFIRAALPRWRYLDLERPSHAAAFLEDPEGALSRLGDGAILDEAQRVPALFPALRSRLDERRSRKGRLVLLGSASPSLVRGISESLAGRVGFLDMTPFQWSETAGRRADFTLENLWLRGGFPAAFLERRTAQRQDWFEAYTRTFIERDLAALGVEVAPREMRRLWAMLAHANGGVWNASQLAASLGVSYHTVNRYVGILEAAFLVRLLAPYFANIAKRLVKSPKVHFRDTGLLHYFLGIGAPGELHVNPGRGASWEAFILEQTISALGVHAPRARPYYWRTAGGAEVDLLVELGRRLVPFEVKLASAPRRADVPGLAACMRDLGLGRGYVLYPGADDYPLGAGIEVLSAPGLLRDPRRILGLVGKP
jgi:predicted AAA+ superfamily ATPase